MKELLVYHDLFRRRDFGRWTGFCRFWLEDVSARRPASEKFRGNQLCDLDRLYFLMFKWTRKNLKPVSLSTKALRRFWSIRVVTCDLHPRSPCRIFCSILRSKLFYPFFLSALVAKVLACHVLYVDNYQFSKRWDQRSSSAQCRRE